MRQHKPVLLKEVIVFLNPGPGKKYIDATVGGGGHTQELLNAGAGVLAIDADPSVVGKLKLESEKLRIRQGNFEVLKHIAEEEGFTEVDGILFDLGLGSHLLDDSERGFSFQSEGPLDMRYNRGLTQTKTAGEIVNFYPEKELLRIFFRFGEERRFGKRIARAIVEQRKEVPLQTTIELFELIKKALPGKFRNFSRDSARKIFQALRIEVNQELKNLERALPQARDLLVRGGRLVVISFHSLEDGIVKQFINEASKDCVCPPVFPECRCAAKATLRKLTKKPVTPPVEEITSNPRSRSAKLRAAERI